MTPSLPEPTEIDRMKRAAAIRALDEITQGMRLGLGTGSTVAFLIPALAHRIRQGLRIEVVATSVATTRAAEAAGIPVRPFDALASVDLAIDGADEIDGDLRAIKGGGGAMLREKIVATAAARMIAIVDTTKQVRQLGAHALPVEILPFAAGFVSSRIEALGGRCIRRMKGEQPFVTDQGNIVLDCAFGPIEHPCDLADALAVIPGMLGHGLFLGEIGEAFVGTTEGVLHLTRKAKALSF